MSEFGIPAKFMQNDGAENKTRVVKVGKTLSDPFDTVRGFRQGDPLSCTLFNLIMESIVRKSGVQRTGTIKNKSVQLLAFADDIDNVDHGLRDLPLLLRLLKKNQQKSVWH